MYSIFSYIKYKGQITQSAEMSPTGIQMKFCISKALYLQYREPAAYSYQT